MREIKFRAWDKNFKKFLEDFVIVQNKTSDLKYEITFFQRNIISKELLYLSKEHIELMQYTGLKDKNGKEIYEGDIIEYNPHTGCKEDITNEEVKWCEDFSGFILDSMCMGLGEFSTEDLKVIGNIYKNPELLK